MGLKGNLTCGEILEQLVHANRHKRVRNIVFMGMGEPLNNYEQVGLPLAAASAAAAAACRRERAGAGGGQPGAASPLAARLSGRARRHVPVPHNL
jgi:hypothetical protein